MTTEPTRQDLIEAVQAALRAADTVAFLLPYRSTLQALLEALRHGGEFLPMDSET